jgi:hypothetical protein
MKKAKKTKAKTLAAKPKPANFMVSDKQQKAGEQGYDNEGALGIGMIRGVK